MNPQTALMANAKRLIKVYIDILFVLLCLIKLNNCNYIVFGCHKKYNYYLMIIVFAKSSHYEWLFVIFFL